MISSSSFSSFSSLECGICFSYRDKNPDANTLFSYPTIIPCCKKDIHLLCLKTWFRQKVSCPFCRKENMFSREGKLLSMKKLYNDQRIPLSSEDKLVDDFDEIFPIHPTIITINTATEERSLRYYSFNLQTIALITFLFSGLILFSTFILPLYQS